MVSTQAESIRQRLRSLVSERVSLDSTSSIVETTLIRGGSFCGRRFSLAGYSVVWFQEEGQIKLYEPTGRLELSCSVLQFCNEMVSETFELRRAA